MMGRQHVLIRRGKNWEDVTHKDAVIYGAGQGCINIMSELQLPKVKYVIDSDAKKWGKQIVLLDQTYLIQPPELLLELPQERYYLVISSERYANEIKKALKSYIDDKNFTICINRKYISFSYESVEDLLFYDPRIKKSLVQTNWSREIDQLIFLFKSITAKVFSGKVISYFLSIENGRNRVVFCFSVDDRLYVFSIPALYCELNTALLPHSPEERKVRYQFRKKYHIGDEMTVYEDDKGVLVQFFANSLVDFGEKNNVQSVLKGCHELHQLDYEFKIRHDFLREIFQAILVELKRVAPWEYDRAKELDNQCTRLFLERERIKVRPRICHGDISCDNIVMWKNSLYLIDWEHMSMSDPLYDVCKFLYIIGVKDRYANNQSYAEVSEKIYADLKNYLSFYYGRVCTDEEYYHAYLVMQIIESEEALLSVFYSGHIEDERYEDIRKRLIRGVTI